MTLVVVRQHGPQISIVSDTMISERDWSLPVQKGVIKSCLLPGDICVSFSNSPELTKRSFQEFQHCMPLGGRFSSVVSFFEEASRKTGNEFIVAFSRQPKIVKIIDGRRVTSQAETQWIGDKPAYEAFREFEAKQRKLTISGRAISAVVFADELNGSPASDLYSVMRNVVQETSLSSVGGFACVISNRAGGFRHSVYSDMLFDWPNEKNSEYSLALTDKFEMGASGENRGYTLSQISTGFLGMNIVTFYLLSGKKLFLFSGVANGLADQCSVLDDVEPDAIGCRLTETLGADLRWLAFVTSSDKSAATTRPRLGDPPNTKFGNSFSFFCHANTFPPKT